MLDDRLAYIWASSRISLDTLTDTLRLLNRRPWARWPISFSSPTIR